MKNQCEFIERHFKDEKTVYFMQSDAHKNIENETYLRYKITGNNLELWMGSDNGEICLFVATSESDYLVLSQIVRGIKLKLI